MTSPSEYLTQQWADEFRSLDMPTTAAYIEASDPSKNPDIWQPEVGTAAVLEPIIRDALDNYADKVAAVLAPYVEQAKGLFS